MFSEQTKNRNAVIQAKYMAMISEKSKSGHQKYTSGYILDVIAEDHGLSPRTVKNIVWETGSYRLPQPPEQSMAPA